MEAFKSKITNTHGKVVNIYIVYEITKIVIIDNYDTYSTLQDALFGAVSLIKNADNDK